MTVRATCVFYRHTPVQSGSGKAIVWTHRRLRFRLGIDYLDLAWTNEYTMIWLAREIGEALKASVVLALGLMKLDTNPFTRREGRGASKPHYSTPRRNLDERTHWWVHLENKTNERILVQCAVC
jgi:hypothetical protein